MIYKMIYIPSPMVPATRSSSTHTSRYGGHAFWRVTEVEQLRLLEDLALLLPLAAARLRHHHNLLEVRRVDEELHFDARALHHVPEDERRIGPAPPHGDEHPREGRGRVRETDGEHRPGAHALRVRSREERADEVLLLGGRERLLEVGHESLALTNGRRERTGGGGGYYSSLGIWVIFGGCGECPPRCRLPSIEGRVQWPCEHFR